MALQIRKMKMMTFPGKDALARLGHDPKCPRCDLDKTIGAAMCKRCRAKLPSHMRKDLDRVEGKDPALVMRALRAAANYFDLHFQSVRNFGGGKKR
jgi:predicted amidophosphoribosyltransferase